MQSAFRDNLRLVRQLTDSRDNATFKQHLTFLPAETIVAIAEGLLNLSHNVDVELTPASRRFVRKAANPISFCLKAAKAGKIETVRRLLRKQGLSFFKRCMLPLLAYCEKYGNSLSVSAFGLAEKSKLGKRSQSQHFTAARNAIAR